MTTTYTLFGQPALSLNSGSANLAATQFQVAAQVNVTTIWFYSIATATALPAAVYVYPFAGGSPVFSALSPAWSGTTGSGWVSYTLPVPLELAAGNYMLTVAFATRQSVVEFSRTNPANGPLSSTEGGYSLTNGVTYPDNLLVGEFLGPDLGVQYLPLVITTKGLPGGISGTTYTHALGVTGGSGGYSWSLQSGQLPAGMTLSSAGVITGPASSGGSGTLDDFTVAVTDSSGVTSTQALSITVTQPPGVMGWDLYSTLQLRSSYYEYYQSVPPVACPNDGEPLRQGPPSEPGVLWCPFDGWRYPRDYDPLTMAGM